MKQGRLSAKNFLSSILKFSVSSWVNFVIGIVSVVITTRIFSPDIYGGLNLFNSTGNFLASFACLGLDGAFLRFFHEPPEGWDKKQLFAKCLARSIAFLVFLSLVGMVFFLRPVSFYLFHKVSFFLTLLLVVNSLSLLVLDHYGAQYYRLDNDALHYSIQVVLVQFCSKLLVIGAAFFSPSLETVLSFNTMGIFFLLLVYGIIQKRLVWPEHYPWKSSGFGEVMRYGLYSWPLTVAFSASSFLVPFLIQNRLDTYALGIFASTNFFVAAFNVVQSGFRTYWAAFMYGHYKDEQEKIIGIHPYVLLFILLLLGGFILFQHVAYLLIGTKFHASRVFFTLVLLDPLLLLLEQTTNYGMALAKRNQEMTIIYILSILLNLLLCYTLLPVFGLVGAACASALAAVVRFSLATWRGQKYYRSIPQIRKTVMGVILLLILGISNFILAQQFAIECSIVACVWIMALILFRGQILQIGKVIQSMSK